MQNRGGADTNGAGATIVTTNTINIPANGSGQPQTNSFNIGETSGSLPITYNFYTAPDQMTVYYGNDPANFDTNSPYLILNTGMVNNPPGPGWNPITAPTNTIATNIVVGFPPPVCRPLPPG